MTTSYRLVDLRIVEWESPAGFNWFSVTDDRGRILSEFDNEDSAIRALENYTA